MSVVNLMGWRGEVRQFRLHIPRAGNAKPPLRAEMLRGGHEIPRFPPSLCGMKALLPWAISSCLFASPRAENRSSLILVSALRLFSRCWVLSCMAESADINTSVSFSFSLYFLSSCSENRDKKAKNVTLGATNAILGGQKCHPGGIKMPSWGALHSREAQESFLFPTLGLVLMLAN